MQKKYQESLRGVRLPAREPVPVGASARVDGVYLASEVDKLRSVGLLRGRWAGLESEEEAESDIQDAHEAMWPDDWGGEEERGEVVSKAPGPVRLYLGNKYNHDVLPTGRVKKETLRRLRTDLEDDSPAAFFQVAIDDEEVEAEQRLAQEEEDAIDREVLNAVQQHVIDNEETEGVREGDKEGGIMGGIRLPGDVTPNQAKSWLSEAIASGPPPERAPPTAGSRDIPDLDGMGHVSAARLEAEAALDAAIGDNDEEAVEAAVLRLQELDEDK